MTVIQTIGKEDGTKAIKTELDMKSPTNVVVSRIIGSKIYKCELKTEDPISFSYIHNFCLLDNDMFISLSKLNQLD